MVLMRRAADLVGAHLCKASPRNASPLRVVDRSQETSDSEIIQPPGYCFITMGR